MIGFVLTPERLGEPDYESVEIGPVSRSRGCGAGAIEEQGADAQSVDEEVTQQLTSGWGAPGSICTMQHRNARLTRPTG